MLQSFVFALLASSALAVPTPKQHQHQEAHLQHNASAFTSFKVASRPRPEILENIDTAHEMKLLLAKYAVSNVGARGILSSINMPAIDLPKVSLPAVGLSLSLPAPAPAPPSHPAPPSLPVPPAAVVSAVTPPKVDIPSLPEIVSDVASEIGGLITKLDQHTTHTHKHKSMGVASSVIATSSLTSSAPVWSSPSVVSSAAAESTWVASTTPEYSAPAPETTTSSEETSPAPSTAAPATTSESSTWVESATTVSTVPETTSIASTTPQTSAAPTTESSTASSSTPSSSSSISSSTYSPSFSFQPTSSDLPSSTSVAPSSTSTKQAATVAATPEENDKEYLSPVTVGGQALNLDFDTGSADLWVFSTSQPSSQTSGHAVFDPSKSSTWSALSGYTWKILYGDGSSASGTVGTDTVAIGGATVTKQAVEIASDVASSFVKDTNNDGLVGLGFSNKNTVSPTKQQTFFENIQNDLQQPLFTVDLKKAATSTYEFGVIDSSKYTGDIHYTGIDSSNGYWQFASTSYAIGGTSYTNSGASPAIADTGTSIILVADATVSAYYSQVSGAHNDASGAGGWVYPCSATLPSFGVGIGSTGFTATVPGSSMTFAVLQDGVTCFGALQSNSGIGYQIFGDTLLKEYFAVFNGGAKTFGLATKA